MTCTICPDYRSCCEEGESILACIACTQTMTRRLRKCTITGEFDYVGSDGMTKAERENYEAIKKIWQQ